MWQIHEELTPSVRAALDEVETTGCHVVRVDTLAGLRALQFDPARVFE